MSAEPAPSTAESPAPAAAPPGSMLAAVVVFVAAGFVIALSLSPVLTGGPILRIDMADGTYGPHFQMDQTWSYGWPASYVVRDWSPNVGRQPVTWSTTEFCWPALVLDLALAAGLIAAGLWLLRWWRASRQHLFQLYLGEIFVLTTLVAGVAGWLYWNHQTHEAELRIVGELRRNHQGEYDEQWCRWQAGGPWWLGELVGHEWFTDFDRVVAIEVHAEDVGKLPGLRSLRVVRLNSEIKESQLQPLEQLPELEALDCWMGVDSPPDGVEESQAIRLPYLPRLRGLNLYNFHATFHPDCAANLPRVEVLELANTDDVTLEVIGRMKSLRWLSLGTVYVSDAALARLRKALPECAINE